MKIKQEHKFGILCMSMWISILFLFSCSVDNKNFNIEISTSGCYKTCPILDIKVIDDKVLFNLIKFNDKNGYYEYKLNPEDEKHLNILLEDINIDELQAEYTSNRVDIQVYSIIITKNNITQKVYYYENDAPKELDLLVKSIIAFKEKDLIESNKHFNIETRKEVPIINTPNVPPPPIKH